MNAEVERQTPPAVGDPVSAGTTVHESITVHGVVQGVGFRPFVYRLARSLNVKGNVSNTADGVLIHAEADPRTLDVFRSHVVSQAPSNARVGGVRTVRVLPAHYDDFRVSESSRDGAASITVPPDLAVCPDCLAELFDPHNRRYRYPFINCTECGPRYSIITGTPYDRARTTMRCFTLCPDCRREYEDPSDRRFHAEPIACPGCGPQVELFDDRWHPVADATGTLAEAGAAIIRGAIVAIKGVGGFHLCVDARNGEAVARLRERKGREAKPLALMYPSWERIASDCEVTETERALLESPAAPIVLVRRRTHTVGTTGIVQSVAPGNPWLGVMLPYSPLHHLLLHDLGFPIVATSGNRSEEPVCYDNEEAFARLSGIADYFLVHNRPIARFIDDSVVRVVAERPLLLRRARGYVPNAIATSLVVEGMLAVGGQQKSTVAVGKGASVYVSRHIGDLDHAAAVEAFRESIVDFETLLRASPSVVVSDLHPDYHSTQHALRSGLAVTRVQHHFAHIASAMADNGIDRDVLGIAWDGTGYGTDGTIWGGEFLHANLKGFQRLASLRLFPLPGGEQAIREPRRVAAGLLHECFGERSRKHSDLATMRAIPDDEHAVLSQMLRRRVNCPMTSSVGRLFDGVASLLGLRQVAQFDGQAAMDVEFAAEGVGEMPTYPFAMQDEDCWRLDWRPMILALVEDLRAGQCAGVAAARFHRTLIEMAAEVACRAARPDVVLSGGCFQNRLLSEGLIDRLRRDGFAVWWHRQVPPNDGGLALGQIAAAAARRNGA